MAHQVISLVGIVIAIVFCNWSVYKGLSLPFACLISGVIIWVTDWSNIQAGWTAAVADFAPIMGTMAPVFIFGSILGLLYARSGAAASLGLALFYPFKNVKRKNAKLIGTIFMFFLLRFLINLSGIDNMAIIPTMVALVTVLCIELDIPRKYANAFLMIAGTIGTFMPMVPTMLNVLLPQLLPGFTASSLAVQRFIFTGIFIVVATFWMARIIAKAQAKGEHFEKGGGMDVGDLNDPNTKRPFWLVTLVPIVVVFLLFNFANFEAWSSMAVGTIVAAVLFIPYIRPQENEKSRFNSLLNIVNQGTIQIPLYYMMSYVPATAMLGASGYVLLTQLFNGMANVMPLALGFSIISMLLVPIGSSALMVNASIATSIFVPAGMSAATCGTLLIVANTVFDTLPNSPGMIMQCDLTATPMKECYPTIFKTTVILTFGILALACIMALIGIL